MTLLCLVFHKGAWDIYFSSFPLNRCLYALCSVICIMLIHQSLDAIAKYFNTKIGDDKWNFGNETYIDIQIVTLYLYLFLVNFWLNLGVWLRDYRKKRKGATAGLQRSTLPLKGVIGVLCKDMEYYAD